MYRWKVVSPIKSSRGDLASGCRSRDFEKKMMSYMLVGITEWTDGTYWFSEFSQILSSENVEVIGRGSSVNDLHVAVLVLTVELLWRRVNSRFVITQLQESLNSTRRMLGSLTVVSVWQAEYETGSL